MKLIVGLGNPGEKYAKTRHNLGFMVLDTFATQHKLVFKSDKSSNSLICRLQTPDSCLLIKPQTFMNDSGQAVSQIAKFYKINPRDILVVHDEIDLPFGTIRSRFGGSSAGHKGIESIIAQLGPDFWRLRIGIGEAGRGDARAFVLANASNKELDSVLKNALIFVDTFIKGDLIADTAK